MKRMSHDRSNYRTVYSVISISLVKWILLQDLCLIFGCDRNQFWRVVHMFRRNFLVWNENQTCNQRLFALHVSVVIRARIFDHRIWVLGNERVRHDPPGAVHVFSLVSAIFFEILVRVRQAKLSCDTCVILVLYRYKFGKMKGRSIYWTNLRSRCTWKNWAQIYPKTYFDCQSSPSSHAPPLSSTLRTLALQRWQPPSKI